MGFPGLRAMSLSPELHSLGLTGVQGQRSAPVPIFGELPTHMSLLAAKDWGSPPGGHLLTDTGVSSKELH